jgi:hypothetical protein
MIELGLALRYGLSRSFSKSHSQSLSAYGRTLADPAHLDPATMNPITETLANVELGGLRA